MNILILEDKENNRKAVEAQLKEHNLTIVKTYDEAMELLAPIVDDDKATANFQKKYPKGSPFWGEKDEAEERFSKEVIEEATTYPKFDMALIDLLLPASAKRQNESFQIKDWVMPVGVFVGLFAAKSKVKLIAVTTDINHHEHPASACLDDFVWLAVEGSRIFFLNMSDMLDAQTKCWSVLVDFLLGNKEYKEPTF